MWILFISLVFAIIFILLVIAITISLVYGPFSTTEKLQQGLSFYAEAYEKSIPLDEEYKIVGTVHLLKPKIQKQIFELFRYLTEKLESGKIVYWLSGYTLLGATQFGILVPWNDSVEITVDYSELRKIKQMKDIINTEGVFVMKQTVHGFCVRYNNLPGYPSIYIILSKNTDNEMVPCSPLTSNGECHYTYSHNDRRFIYDEKNVFPLRRIQFDESHTFVPKNTEVCLQQSYGEQWNKSIHPRTNTPVFFNNAWVYGISEKIKNLMGLGRM